MKKLKSIKISEEAHKQVKIYCAINEMKVIDWIEYLIKKELENDNNEKN